MYKEMLSSDNANSCGAKKKGDKNTKEKNLKNCLLQDYDLKVLYVNQFFFFIYKTQCSSYDVNIYGTMKEYV